MPAEITESATCLSYFERVVPPVVAHLWEGKIDMNARRQVTNKPREAYQGASKPNKGRILDEVVSTTGVARSSAHRLLLRPKLLIIPASV